MKKLLDYTLPSDGILSVTGIPGTYKNLIIYATLQDSSSSNANGGRLAVNGQSETLHSTAYIYGFGQGNGSSQATQNNYIEYLAPGSSSNTNSRGALKIVVPDYTGTGRKRFIYHSGMAHSNETSFTYTCLGYVSLDSSSAVTSFTLTPQGGAVFKATRTQITIYGV